MQFIMAYSKSVFLRITIFLHYISLPLKSLVAAYNAKKCNSSTLKRIEDAGEEENGVRERSEVQESETPSCPKEAAETPDTEKCHTVLPPFIPGSDLPIDQEEHHNARKHQDGQDRHIGEIVRQPGLVVVFHPAPGHTKYS